MSTDDEPGTALAVRSVASLTAYEPRDVSEGYALAQYLAKSGMLGKDIKTAEQALTVMIAGRELGFTAMQSLRAIYIVEGRVTLSADAMVALVLRSPECEYLMLVSTTAEECTYKTKRRGGEEVTMSVTAADAKIAGWTNTHTKYPAIMKRHRCASNICRAVYPDVVLGMFSPEEMEEVVAQERPEPVQPLTSTAVSRTIDSTATQEPPHDPQTGEVHAEAVREWTPEQTAVIRALGGARTDDALAAARKALMAIWPKMADAPEDVQALYREAKLRVEALKKEQG